MNISLLCHRPLRIYHGDIDWNLINRQGCCLYEVISMHHVCSDRYLTSEVSHCTVPYLP